MVSIILLCAYPWDLRHPAGTSTSSLGISTLAGLSTSNGSMPGGCSRPSKLLEAVEAMTGDKPPWCFRGALDFGSKWPRWVGPCPVWNPIFSREIDQRCAGATPCLRKLPKLSCIRLLYQQMMLALWETTSLGSPGSPRRYVINHQHGSPSALFFAPKPESSWKNPRNPGGFTGNHRKNGSHILARDGHQPGIDRNCKGFPGFPCHWTTSHDTPGTVWLATFLGDSLQSCVETNTIKTKHPCCIQGEPP